MTDVVVVGAGPAGAVAATLLARAGARVRMFDRATFPREKLCGDTVNPGTLAILERLGLAHDALARGVKVEGMIVSGEGGVTIVGRYPRGLYGRALTRSEFDWALVQEAVAAGAQFEAGTTVRGAMVADRNGVPVVVGVRLGSQHGDDASVEAPVTIAADGRRSTVAFGMGLARHPSSPRRWAMGAYFEGAAPGEAGVAFGEMHIRRGRYLGVSSVARDLTNVALVKPSTAGDAEFKDPVAALDAAIGSDALLADRFRRARMIAPPVLLGPLAVEATGRTFDGLIVAGDAAGFVDPMTGDGLRFAVRGGELAAEAALRALQHGWPGVHASLDRARRGEFAAKRRFNLVLRTLVSFPMAVSLAAGVARVLPGLVSGAVARAGDCDRAG
jgi:menaquinone-9 beta-reductase